VIARFTTTSTTTAAPICPRCRRDLPAGATDHPACGWNTSKPIAKAPPSPAKACNYLGCTQEARFRLERPAGPLLVCSAHYLEAAQDEMREQLAGRAHRVNNVKHEGE
jgi:hypothetical protein